MSSIAEFIYTVLLKPPLLRHAANAVIKALLPEQVRLGEAVISINPNDPVVSGALLFQVYERDEIAFFRSHFGRDMTFIDVGANVGLYTGIALSTPGFQGRVLALEPHGESRMFLQQTVQSNIAPGQQADVTICDIAASDMPGIIKLYMNSENKGDNRLYPDPLLDQEETVMTDTLDAICQRHQIEAAHFLKIDVQGAEAKAINGARHLLKNSVDCILMSEFWPYGLSRNGSDPSEYLATLDCLGFKLYELGKRLVPVDNPQALIARTQGRNYANILGLKGKFTQLAV